MSQIGDVCVFGLVRGPKWAAELFAQHARGDKTPTPPPVAGSGASPAQKNRTLRP